MENKGKWTQTGQKPRDLKTQENMISRIQFSGPVRTMEGNENENRGKAGVRPQALEYHAKASVLFVL